MIVGSVATSGDVQVHVTVRGANGRLRSVEAVLDTGFNGFLTLPAGQIETLGLTPKTETRVRLASGEVRSVATYQAPVALGAGSSPQTAVEIFEAGEVLIGAGLLWGCDVHIRYVEGGRVEIVAAPGHSARGPAERGHPTAPPVRVGSTRRELLAAGGGARWRPVAVNVSSCESFFEVHLLPLPCERRP